MRVIKNIGEWFDHRLQLAAPIREAVEHEFERVRSEIPLIERLKPIQEELKSLSKPGGLPADKAFFDELSGDI